MIDELTFQSPFCQLFSTWDSERMETTYSIDTGVVVSMRSESEYAPVNKNDNYANVIGYLNSYSKYFDCCDTPVTVDPFYKFIDDF